ncbi:hypothetical protein D3C81_1996870 [compost metagenome]
MTTALTGKAGTVAVQLPNTEAFPILDLQPAQQPVRLLLYPAHRFLFGQTLDLREVVTY